jgi:hypothetical protein
VFESKTERRLQGFTVHGKYIYIPVCVKVEFDEAIMTRGLQSYIRSLCPGLARQKRDLYLKVIWQSAEETFSWI